MEQNRFKSWALWLAIAALIVYVVDKVWGVNIAPAVDELMDLLLPILIAFGVVNNPTVSNKL